MLKVALIQLLYCSIGKLAFHDHLFTQPQKLNHIVNTYISLMNSTLTTVTLAGAVPHSYLLIVKGYIHIIC